MMNKAKLTCSTCNSVNTIMESKASYTRREKSSGNIFSKVANTLISSAENITSSNSIGGSFVVTCKGCGNISFVMIN